jgi:aminoglycoside phosphotransferase (APT) family kinase protein
MSKIMIPAHTLAWVEESIGSGSEVTAYHPQSGATSSTLHRLDILYRGQTQQLMLRRFTNEEWLAEEPDIAAHEASNLEIARGANIPTPELIAYDPEGNDTDVPALLMTILPGSVDLLPIDFDDWLYQQVETILKLHALEVVHYPWQYAPYFDITRLEPPPWSRKPHLWERMLEIVNGSPPSTPDCFIHRDYHPVNVLWQGRQLSGVVDWANACLGPPGIDIAWQRSNLASLYGFEAAERFLSYYQNLTGASSAYHPFWDLMAITDSIPGPPEVYPPWVEYGVPGLNVSLMMSRAENYLASVLEKWDAVKE